MAKYYLVENRQIVHLGPVDWKYRFIQAEIDDLGVDYQVPPNEPGYVKINDNLELLPLAASLVPDHNPTYQQLSGPVLKYNDDKIYEEFSIINRPLHSIQDSLMDIVSKNRYEYEHTSIDFTFNDIKLKLPTSREFRSQLVDILLTIGDSNINYKLNGNFYNLNKADINNIIKDISDYVQAQFNWEYNTHSAIRAASTIEQLKAITLEK